MTSWKTRTILEILCVALITNLALYTARINGHPKLLYLNHHHLLRGYLFKKNTEGKPE